MKPKPDVLGNLITIELYLRAQGIERKKDTKLSGDPAGIKFEQEVAAAFAQAKAEGAIDEFACNIKDEHHPKDMRCAELDSNH